MLRNVVGFTASRPPWTIFVICLGACAFGFLMLGYYVRHNEGIVDSEATRGWEDLYSNLSSLQFCFNESLSQDTQQVAFDYKEHEMVNVSLPFQLVTKPYQGSVGMNASNFAGAIPYLYFKFGRHVLHETQVWIDFVSRDLFGHCIYDEGTSKCKEMTYSACVTVSLPNFILPLIKPHPCNITKGSPRTSKVYIIGSKESKKPAPDCKEKEVQISLSKHQDYSSEVLLSLAERTHLNLELQLTSYILFVIFLSFLLYAALKGRPLKL